MRAEGCGVVVLKRLADAVRDGDRVLAVVRGSAVNHDGRSGGLTAPSSKAQAALIREAWRRAGVTADDVSMIEAHGTGTSLGDPIEMEALGEVFRGREKGLPPVVVGSVKTNFGHAEAAASGIAGLLKLVMVLQAKTIPPHLHFKTPSSFIPWSEIPFVVPLKAAEWTLAEGQTRRVAGVSSFGFSGTNAHVVLEEFVASAELPVVDQVKADQDRADQDRADQDEPRVVVLSGRSAGEALTAGRERLAEWVEAHAEAGLADVAATLALGRVHQAHRAAWVVRSKADLLDGLKAEGSGWRGALAAGTGCAGTGISVYGSGE